ncbi:MAG TPA: GNAT family N-acetyltransferase, partial [Clostridia bacterium]|nr:GNAT family N-acetyltransferase [Clostridia bacterium]
VLRGKGYGKAMLLAAVEYAKINLNAEIITLGVFANNDNAKYCYQSVGFKSVGKNENYQMPLGEWECIEMSLSL